jgi:hypothetical protein
VRAPRAATASDASRCRAKLREKGPPLSRFNLLLVPCLGSRQRSLTTVCTGVSRFRTNGTNESVHLRALRLRPLRMSPAGTRACQGRHCSNPHRYAALGQVASDVAASEDDVAASKDGRSFFSFEISPNPEIRLTVRLYERADIDDYVSNFCATWADVTLRLSLAFKALVNITIPLQKFAGVSGRDICGPTIKRHIQRICRTETRDGVALVCTSLENLLGPFPQALSERELPCVKNPLARTRPRARTSTNVRAHTPSLALMAYALIVLPLRANFAGTSRSLHRSRRSM